MTWYQRTIPISASVNPAQRNCLYLVDLAAAAGNVTIRMPASAGVPTYVGVVNASPVGDGSKVIDIEDPTGAFMYRLSARGAGAWFVQIDGTNNWGLALYSNPGEYEWIWADAAARNACQVSADQMGKVGFQLDIGLPYQLASQPSAVDVWQDLAPLAVAPMLAVYSMAGVTLVGQAGLSFLTTQGTPTAVTLAATNYGTRLSRTANVTSALAGSSATFRSSGLSTGLPLASGIRYDMIWTLGVPSTNWRWFVGIDGAPSANVDPNTFVSCIGVGRRNGEANVQLLHNDAAGVCTQVDLGGDFPASTQNTPYRFQLRTPDAVDYYYQLTNLETGAQISGSVNANVPDATNAPIWVMYCNNNTDAQAVTLHMANVRAWQPIRAF